MTLASYIEYIAMTMCGIIGYIGTAQATPFIVEGLRRMEYRGYDSAGIVTNLDGNFQLVRAHGKVSVLADKVAGHNPVGTTGIGHTRWATHGPPNEQNAHPHLAEHIALVHNGIIENYEELREELADEGIQFASQTDSEVLAWLINKHYNDDLLAAVIKSLEKVRGTYGIAVLANEGDNRLVAARMGSPILVGETADGWCVASDGAALAGKCSQVLYLEDNEIVVCDPNGYQLYDSAGNPKTRDMDDFNMPVETIEKQGHAHFLMKEIAEQPEVIQRALSTIESKPVLDSLAAKNLQHIMITACGTAYHAGLFAKYLLERWCGVPVSVEFSSEFRYRGAILPGATLGIVISQSGETADTIAALGELKRRNITTVGIVNVVGSTISREVDSVRYLHVGPEISVASTKAFTMQVIMLLRLGIELGLQREIIDQNLADEINAAFQELPDQMQLVLDQADAIKDKVGPFKDFEHAFYLGRDLLYPIAMEGSLKLKEISYIHSEAYPSGEMKHGAIALIDENLFTVALLGKGNLFEKSISNLAEIQARSGIVLSITDEPKYASKHSGALLIQTGHFVTAPLVFNVVLQLVAYFIADARGCPIDQPRNLAKSVTVE